MEISFAIGDLIRLYCEGQPQDKFYIVLDVASDVEKEPPMYKLFSLNTGDEAGWHYEHHSMSKLYSFRKVISREYIE